MSDTTFDEATKHRVRDAMAQLAREELEATRDTLASQQEAAEIDQDEPVGSDETSQSDTAGEMHGLLEEALERQEAGLAAIEALDVSAADVARVGAIVGFGGQRYLVGVVSGEVEVDGATYEGISADSPAFGAIEGLRAGETFTVNDREQRIEIVG
jgi:transcription elongation GreA/GreB family factor